jgi:DNA polymerase I-like protein with 3'-5' exonuclease and polymerase domains
MLGIFWRTKALLNRDKYLLINTVHDSVMLDCKSEFINQAYKDLKVLENVKEVAEEYFNDNLIVPIQVEISHGQSWADLK